MFTLISLYSYHIWYSVTIVMGTREAAIDAQTISLVSDLGNEQLRNIKTDVVNFDPRVFNQKIVSTLILWSDQVIMLCVCVYAVNNTRWPEVR